MPFRLDQEEVRDIAKILRRGKKDFSWCEQSLLSLIATPLNKSDVYWAAIGLRDCGTVQSVAALKQLAFFPSQEIAACAILTIAQICGASETPYYASCLADRKYKAKDFALWALGVCGDIRAFAAVEQYVRKNKHKLAEPSALPQAQLEILAYLYRHAETHPAALNLLREFAFLTAALDHMSAKMRSDFLYRCPGIEAVLTIPGDQAAARTSDPVSPSAG